MQSASTTAPAPGDRPEIQTKMLGRKEPYWFHETINMIVRDIRPSQWPERITFAFGEHACSIESIPRSLCHIHNDPDDQRHYVQLCFAPGTAHPTPVWNDEQPTEAIINLLSTMAAKSSQADCREVIEKAEKRARRRFTETIRRPLTAYEAALLAAQGPRALWPDSA